MISDNGPAWGYRTSTGLGFTTPAIVDTHFAACRTAYGGLIKGAGLRRGEHVLDAGCGSGSFLPLIAGIIGAHGSITAVDLATENVAATAERLRRQPLMLTRPVPVVRASLLHLPFPDDSFDAAWCANTVQYLDDEELLAALGELRRVVRPGGAVAVKDLDASLITAWPGDPFLFSDFFRLAAQVSGYARQLLRSRELHRWLIEAGLTAVRQQTTLIEHYAPYPEPARAFYGASCADLARQARALGAAGAWAKFEDDNGPDHPLNHPYGFIREGNVLSVGTVPRWCPSCGSQGPNIRGMAQPSRHCACSAGTG